MLARLESFILCSTLGLNRLGGSQTDRSHH